MMNFLLGLQIVTAATVLLAVFIFSIVNIFKNPDEQDRYVLVATVFMGCLLLFYFFCDLYIKVSAV